MKFYKGLFLFFLLLFPVLIYLFLQGFGENKFNVPIYYQVADSLKVKDCKRSINIPFVVDRNILSSDSKFDLSGKFIVYEYSNGSKLARNNTSSFLQKYEDIEKVVLLSLIEQDSLSKTPFSTDRNITVSMDSIELIQFMRCELQIDINESSILKSQLVLTDDVGQIRGYFDPLEMEEIDRLSTELLIVIQNHEETLN